MKSIQLTQGKKALVDDEDFELVGNFNWYLSSSGYAVRSCHGITIAMHRVIANTPAGKETDHINHNKLDNRRSNLRECDKFENAHNRAIYKNNTSGYKGVYLEKRWNPKWQAKIRLNNKLVNIGSFKSKIAAARAYNAKAIELHGEFARLNNV